MEVSATVTAWLWIIGILVVTGTLIGLTIYSAQRHVNQDRREHVVATLNVLGRHALRATETELIVGYKEDGERHSIVGLVARVEDGGSVNRRMTVTRLAALGVLAAALPKKQDDREVFFTVEGPRTVIVWQIPVKDQPDVGARARAFAAQVNRLSKAATPSSDSAAAMSNAAAPDAAEIIRSLSALRDEGILTEAEFAQKKADLLDRL